MNNPIKNKIVWKIYFIWLFKRIIPLFIAELVFLVLAFYFLGKLVFVSQVFQNAFLSSAQNPFTVALYMFDAFLATGPVKKIIIVILLSLGVLFMRDIGRMIVSYASTARITKKQPKDH